MLSNLRKAGQANSLTAYLRLGSRRPLLIDPFKNDGRFFYGLAHEKTLCEIWLVRVDDIYQLPRTENCCGK